MTLKSNLRILLAWALTLPVVFFAIGFLDNYYSAPVALVFLSLSSQTLAEAFLFRVLSRAERALQTRRGDFILGLILFIILSVFTAAMFARATRFPSLFNTGFFLPDKGNVLFIAMGSLSALPCLVWIVSFVRKKGFAFPFIDENLAGMAVAAFFFFVAFVFASIFNQPAFDVDDIFFDTDGLLWRLRFVTADWQDYYRRSVHPFALLLIRSLIAFLSMFLKGDRLSAAFILIAGAGALCVFLAWYFVKKAGGDSLFALLIASLLGASAAQLVFSALIETYIFLAFAQILFFALLISPRAERNSSFVALVLVGLATVGITLTNFAQAVIGFIVVRRDLKKWILFGVIVSLLVFPLTLLNNHIYPNANPYFFDFSSLNTEADNMFTPSMERGLAIARVMTLYSVVAPDPLILREEIPFLKVWMFKAEPLRMGEYGTGLGKVIALFWLGLALLGGILFLKNIKKRDNRYSISFILILLFNFALHLFYGKDVFLYSVNWTYALVLLLALAWMELSKRKWFQVVLLLFLALLLANNARLILAMLSASALHIK